MSLFTNIMSRGILKPCFEMKYLVHIPLRRSTNDGTNLETRNLIPTTNARPTNNQMVTYIKTPQLLESKFPGFKCVLKDQIEDAIKGYKIFTSQKFYILPDGRVSRSSNDKDIAHFICIKKHLIALDNATKNLKITNIQCLNSKEFHENFDSHAIIEHFNVELKEDSNCIPDIGDSCVRSIENVEDQKLKLGNFKNISNRGVYLRQNDSYEFVRTRERSDSVGFINHKEYTNLTNNDTKAILISVAPDSRLKELQKMVSYGFLQVYSAKKQALISTTEIVDKMKNLEIGDSDFFVKDFREIQNDKNLEMSFKEQKCYYQKGPDGKFKNFKTLKEKPALPDLVCQKYQYECENEPSLTYYILRIIETTDKELQQFVGKAFVQKVDEDHQTITKPDEVLEYMQDKIKVQKMKFNLFGSDVNL